MSRHPIIDFHAHVICADVMKRNRGRNVFSGWQPSPGPPPGDTEYLVARMTQPDLALQDMDRLGIDVSVLSTTTVMQNSAWAAPKEQAELEALANDEIASWAAYAPERFAGSCTLPLTDIGLTLTELDRCVSDLGFRVVNLPAVVGDEYLGAPRFAPLWEAIHDKGLVAFLHPDGTRDPWFQDYWMWNSIGQPIEEVKMLTSLILEGVLDRHEGLKIIVAHGGGFLPHYAGRLDRNVKNQPRTARNISRLPSEYLDDLYYDTCAYDKRVLSALLERFGAGQLVMGSDYPVGDPDPVGFVRRTEALDDPGEELILGVNAKRLLGLGAPS